MKNLVKCKNVKAVRAAMKTTAFTLILMLIGILAVQAQDNYKLGYIITNENDTINGWIDYRTDAQNGEVCKFKTTENGKE